MLISSQCVYVCFVFSLISSAFKFLLLSFHFHFYSENFSLIASIILFCSIKYFFFWLRVVSHFPNVWGPFLVGLFRYRSVEYSYILLQRGCLQCRIYHKQNYSTSSCYSDCNTLCFDRNVSPTINSNKSDNNQIPKTNKQTEIINSRTHNTTSEICNQQQKRRK